MAALDLGVKLFASVREALGTDSVRVSVAEGSRVRDLMDALASEHPEIERRRRALAVAVNHEIVGAERLLAAGDEVALIPPVGGG